MTFTVDEEIETQLYPKSAESKLQGYKQDTYCSKNRTKMGNQRAAVSGVLRFDRFM